MSWSLVAAVVGVLCLIVLYRRDRSLSQKRRAAFFADCLHLFKTYRVVQDDIAYPVLTGTYKGHDVRLEPIVDHLAWRKLPVLWLKVSVLKPIPYQGVLDFLMRPLGIEFYSPTGHLDHRLKLPDAWPQDAVLYTDDEEAIPPLELLSPTIALFADTDLKELVITPKGVRLVCQVGQASRPHYMVFREIKFDDVDVDPTVIAARLDAAIALVESLSAPRSLQRVA